MTEAEILTSVKKTLGITGAFLDDTLKMYIDEVKQYLTSAGVLDTVINSSASVGVIARGVCDLWNYGSSGGKLSDYFYQRAVQLSYQNSVTDNGGGGSE